MRMCRSVLSPSSKSLQKAWNRVFFLSQLIFISRNLESLFRTIPPFLIIIRRLYYYKPSDCTQYNNHEFILTHYPIVDQNQLWYYNILNQMINLLRSELAQASRRVRYFPIQMVPQQKAYVVETFGKFTKVMNGGLNFMIPFVQKVAHVHSLKEESHTISRQSAFTKDNVSVDIDTVLYLKVSDPYLASYGAYNSVDYACKLAQCVMRSQIGNLSLDQTFSSREKVNEKVLDVLSTATEPWGIICTRHEIKDIRVSERIKRIMALEAESERLKRAEILGSQAKKTAILNDAEAIKRSTILIAEGEAQNKILIARAIGERVKVLEEATKQSGFAALDYMLAESYIDSLHGLKHKNVLLEANLNNPSEIIKRALDLSSNPQKLDANLNK